VGAFNMTTKTKSILFCRVSSKEQEETGYSLPAQEKLLEDYANKKNYHCSKIFSISESASGHKRRKIFDQMIKYLKKQNINIIICEKVDRLTRNLRDAVVINEWVNGSEKREVHFLKENFVLHKNSMSHDKFIWNIKVSTSQFYIDNLSEEVKKGQKEKLTQGWLPTKPPFGYKTVGEKGHKIHIIDEEIAPLVKKMFNLYATGNYSIKKLSDKMYDVGLRSRTGSKLSKSRLHTTLRDPFYIGINVWNDHEYPGKQEQFINKAIFDKVQAMMSSKTTPKYNKHNFLFKGLIACDECSGTITWETQKGNIYGHCNHYRNCSQKTWAKEHEVENQLIDAFSKLEVKNKRLSSWIVKALKESHKDEIEYYTTSVNELNKQLEQTKRRLDKLYDDKLDEKISESFYDRKFRQYATKRDDLIHKIKTHSNTDTKYFQLGINIYKLSQKAREIYKKADPDNKRVLLRLVFQNMTLDEGILSWSYSPAFQQLHDAVFYTNKISSKQAKIDQISDIIFEPNKKTDESIENNDLNVVRSNLLPG
jgi:site-specific DNA recombinase